MSRDAETVDIDDVSWVAETEAAICFETADEREVWIPRSLCEWDGETLTIQLWKAKELGLV